MSGSESSDTVTSAPAMLPWPENDSLPWSVPLPRTPSPRNATGASSGHAIVCAASEKSASDRAAAGEVVASRQSSLPAWTDTAATVARHDDGADAAADGEADADADAVALAAPLAADVGKGNLATGVAVPDGASAASSRLTWPRASRTAKSCGASTSMLLTRTRRSSGLSSSIASFTLPTSSSCFDVASTIFTPSAATVPDTLSESVGRCSKAISRSAPRVAARSCAGRLRGR